MLEYFARDYRGGEFVLFGLSHWLAIAAAAAACLLIAALRGRFTPRARTATRWSFAIFIYTCEFSWQVWMLLTGQWTIQGMLPLWLCSVTSWTMPLLLILRSRRYYEWAYFMGLLGGTQALLTPDLTIYSFPHFRFIEWFALHGMLIVAVVYMTVVEGFRPVWGSLPRVIATANLYWLGCGIVNSLIGSNYLYTHGKLPTPSLLDLLGPWPWYLLAVEALAVIFCGLVYLPFALRDWRAAAARR